MELRFSDGSTIAIDTIAVENEFAETWLDRRELDYLIYNDPLGYADLVLNGDVKSISIRRDRDRQATNNKALAAKWRQGADPAAILGC